MSLFSGLKISASALSVERLRMNVIAENIANAETTRTPEGGPYRRREVQIASSGEAPGVYASVASDPRPDRLMYDPSHPEANAEGYVRMPNVDLPAEMVDMMTATRAYEANTVAFQSQRQTQERTLELLA
ncbi:MAG: flagellar basal body rod protein FlgC [Armatimonadia bacterium]